MVGILETCGSILEPGKCFCWDCKLDRVNCGLGSDGQIRKESPPSLELLWNVVASSGIASNYGAFYFSVGGMLLFVLTFAVGAGPVPGLLLPEIFPSRIRAKAMAFCMSVHWVVNFFVGLMFLRLLDQLGPHLLYSIFGTFCVMAVVFVKRNVMETKGKSLQEIEIALLPQE